MGLGGDRFGLGINWLQRLAEDDHDQRGTKPLRSADLPPMFRPDNSVHSGRETMIESVKSTEDNNVVSKT
jgi:hypothetical protein